MLSGNTIPDRIGNAIVLAPKAWLVLSYIDLYYNITGPIIHYYYTVGKGGVHNKYIFEVEKISI